MAMSFSFTWSQAAGQIPEQGLAAWHAQRPTTAAAVPHKQKQPRGLPQGRQAAA